MGGQAAGGQAGSAHRGSEFDALALSAQRRQLGGVLDGRALARVGDRLAGSDAAPLDWTIAGTSDPLGRSALTITLDGSVPLECQRCLRVFAWPVRQRTLLLLARDDAEHARLDQDDEHEVLLASAPLDARALIEDELLLTLPFVPRCADPQCEAAAASGTPVPPAAPGAFAALAKLSRPASTKQ